MSYYLAINQWLTYASIAVSVVATYGFLWEYRQTSWRSHEMGRHIMAFSAMMAVTLTLALISVLTASAPLPNNWPGQPIVRSASYVGIAALLVWRWSLLHRAQHPTDRSGDEPTEEEPGLGGRSVIGGTAGGTHLRERGGAAVEADPVLDPARDRSADGGADLRG